MLLIPYLIGESSKIGSAALQTKKQHNIAIKIRNPGNMASVYVLGCMCLI